MAEQLDGRLKQFISYRKKGYLKDKILKTVIAYRNPLDLDGQVCVIPEEVNSFVMKSYLKKNSLQKLFRMLEPEDMNELKSKVRVFREVIRESNENAKIQSSRLSFENAYQLQKEKYKKFKYKFKEYGPSSQPGWKLASEQEHYKESQAKLLKELRNGNKSLDPYAYYRHK